MNKANSIIWKIESDIGHLILNRPPGNDMTIEFFDDLENLISNVIPISNVKAIIISGTGRHFSSGADISSLLDIVSQNANLLDTQEEETKNSTLISNIKTFKFFEKLTIPTIAAISGICIGSALELAMYCHFRICAKGAVLGLPESSFGLLPGIGGIQKMNSLAGKSKTIELTLKGNTFRAEEALKWHIVDKLVEKNLLTSTAMNLAEIASVRYKKFNKSDYLLELA